MNGHPDHPSGRRGAPGPLTGLILSALILSAWIWGLNWTFSRLTGDTYFHWYVQNGTLISVATAFVALVWQGLEAQQGLLSWHPGKFIRSCMTLASVFYSAVAVNLSGPLDGAGRRADDPVSILETLWDSAFGFLMALLMGIAMLGWVIVVAPLHYLVTLVTGAPARQEIRGTGRRLIVQTDGPMTMIQTQPATMPIPDGALDVSFGVRPFALTNALNGAVLLTAKLLLPAGT